MELEQTLQEYRYQEQQMALTTSSLQRQLERVTEEKEEREKEAVSWFNALEVRGILGVCTLTLHYRYDDGCFSPTEIP